MKSNNMVVVAFAAACLVAACSTSTDALENSGQIVEDILTPQELSEELVAKMEATPWVNVARTVSLTFGCNEEDQKYLTFEVIEHVHKVFASDGEVYFVTGAVLPGEGQILDEDGNVYQVEFNLEMPAQKDASSRELYQHMTMYITGQGYMQSFEEDLLVESNISPVFNEEEKYPEDLFKSDLGISRIVPDAILGSCEG